MKRFSVILLIFTLLILRINAQDIFSADSLSVFSADSLSGFSLDSLSLIPADPMSQTDSTVIQSIADKKKALKKDNLSNDNIKNPRTASRTDTEIKPKNVDFKPDPLKVIWMGAIIPGYGQILNRSYWKLPLVYSSFLGCAYAIGYYSKRYETYKSAYRDFMDPNPDNNSYLNLLPEGATVESIGLGRLQEFLQNNYKSARRAREISIYASVAVYAICIIEAYVEAQMFDFDISPDLSLQLHPTIKTNNFGKVDLAGVGVSIRLK